RVVRVIRALDEAAAERMPVRQPPALVVAAVVRVTDQVAEQRAACRADRGPLERVMAVGAADDRAGAGACHGADALGGIAAAKKQCGRNEKRCADDGKFHIWSLFGFALQEINGRLLWANEKWCRRAHVRLPRVCRRY